MWPRRRVILTGAIMVILSTLQQCEGSYLELDNRGDKYTFPDDFMFGVSTAAFQIEGAWNEGGKGESIWDKYLHYNPDYTPDKSNGDIATDSYHKYMEDIDMIKNLGVGFYRTSISWPRVLPNGTDNNVNMEGVMFYRRYLKQLLKANIIPVITIYHWDMPVLLMDLGGLSNPVIVDYLEDYARVLFHYFGDLVKYWVTVNEPHQHCVGAYGGKTIPGIASPGVAFYLCAHHLLLAHARIYRLYEREFRFYQKGKITIALDANWIMPKHPDKPEDQEAADRHLEMHVAMFADPIFSQTADYPALVRQRVDNASLEQGFFRSRLPYFTKEEMEALRGSADYFGLNHYTTFLMSPSSMEEGWQIPSYDHDAGVKLELNPLWPVPGIPWLSVYPPGFREMIKWISKRYGKDVPIIITESGMADHGQLEDYDRVNYFNEYMYQMLQAIHEDGCNVKGYFAWTLMDNFEWDFGFTEKFGLYQVDFSDPNRTRTPKLSAKTYKNTIYTRRIDFNYMRPPTDHNKFFD